MVAQTWNDRYPEAEAKELQVEGQPQQLNKTLAQKIKSELRM